MRWLLDTNIVSENLRRAPDKKVLQWIEQQPREQTAISIVTMAELRDGADSVLDPVRRQTLLNWIGTEIAESFGARTLPVTMDILMEWLRIGRKLAAQRRPSVTPDTLIAATALVHGLIVVSRNVRDFIGTGVTVYNPWTDEMHKMESL